MKKILAFVLMLLALNAPAHARDDSDRFDDYLFLNYGPPSVSEICQNTPTSPDEFLRLAKDGNPQAQKDLGCLYHDGRGVTKDPAQAKEWFIKSADQGNADAQFILWFWFLSPENISEGMKWLRKAYDQGHALAEVTLGFSYLKGFGVEKNEGEGRRLLLNQAEKGNFYAQNILGGSYWSPAFWSSNSETVKWLRMVADQGFAPAEFNMGFLYCRGYGVKKDIDEAIKWYKKSADHGYFNAQMRLGYLYEKGDGVPRDEEEAIRWYRLAAEGNHQAPEKALALRALRRLYAQ